MPTPFGQLAAHAVHQRFATRPQLFSVVFNALRERLLEHYPALNIDLLNTQLASPSADGGYTYQLLLNFTIAHVLKPQPIDWQPRREQPFFLAQDTTGNPAPPASTVVDMSVLAQLIDELPSALSMYFQQAIADYWSDVDSHGNSRWQWLGEFLNGQLSAAATAQSSLTDLQRSMLSSVATWPLVHRRLPRATPATYAYFIETTLCSADQRVSLLTPDLLLVCDTQVLLCGVDGNLTPYPDIDAFSAAWGARFTRQFQFDSLTWRRNEPDGNVFEQQAGLILNQQLEDLAHLSFQDASQKALDQRLQAITDPARWFTRTPQAAPARLQTVHRQLPDWLKNADADDRFAYHRHLQDLAQVTRLSHGRAFNEGIETLQGFSREALRKQMQTDHGDCDPDSVLLDFAVAAGYPGGAGIIDHVQMTLTELAVKNLAGKPKGTLTLASTSPHALPQWLTEDYLLGSDGLIQRVDIGSTYPHTLKEKLLSDSVDARRRESLFVRQLKVQLPMQALEFKIRRQHGISTTGYRYVQALLADTPEQRQVDGQEVVLRPLALCRQSGSTPDPVNNQFIIEAKDPSSGPHLLYRPLYRDALHEYPTRQALLAALARPGELQDDVLTWLSDKARPIYAHGGIHEPHIVRFLSGDESVIAQTPAPATLAIDEGAEEWLQAQVNGQLPSHLFGSTARALVDLADRQSVSNSESRWAVMMEGAWLLFNTLLLPLVRGPAMLAGWFMVTVSSLEKDLADLDSPEPITRELALIDLMLNLAMVLLHATAPAQRPLAQAGTDEHALNLEPWRHAPGLPHEAPAAKVNQGSVALPGEPPATGSTALDFSRSIASPQASAMLLDALLTVHVPWPTSLPAAQASGPLKGLYRIGDRWHASVGGLLFQVSVVPGFAEVYLVHPQRPQHPGFKLTHDAQGHWRLDRRARLEGGMPRERLTEWQRQRNQQIQTLSSELGALGVQFVNDDHAAAPYGDALNAARTQLIERKKSLRRLWELLGKALPQLQAQVAERHQQEQLLTAQAKAEYTRTLGLYLQLKQQQLPRAQHYQAKALELMAIDRANPRHRRMYEIATHCLYGYWGTIWDTLLQRFSDTIETARGESYDELAARVTEELRQGVNHAYEEVLELWKTQAEVFQQMIEPAEKMEAIIRQADPAQRKFLMEQNPQYDAVSSIGAKQSVLVFMAELVFDRTHDSRTAAEHPFVLELVDPNRDRIILAHSEIRSTSGYSSVEQMAVLRGALELYERMENAVNSLAELDSGFIREAYREPFLKHLTDARSAVEAQLADLILVDEGFAPPAPVSHTRAKAANKTVFKTRSHKTLIGNLRPALPDAPGRFIEIQDPITRKVLATYLEHASEGVWVEVVPAVAAMPSPLPVVRAVEAIDAQAQTLLARRAPIERSIRTQQKKLLDPIRREELRPLEWEEMLTPTARQLEALANELARDHASDAHSATRVANWRAAANAMIGLARELCGEGYKQQRPKAANIAYLWRHGFVDINLVRSRIALKAGDYLTEYAVRDKARIKEGKKGEDTVLWYAHFHYPSVDTPALKPAFGHLKTREERRFTRKELIEQARLDNRSVVNLDKAVINPPLDRELFLRLETSKP